MEIQTPERILINFCPHLFKEGFGAVLTPAPTPLGLGAWNSKSWRTDFWKLFTKQKMFNRLQINQGSAGYLS